MTPDRPGIPATAPGEGHTEAIIDHVQEAIAKDRSAEGAADQSLSRARDAATGGSPNVSKVALVIIDMLNTYEHRDATPLRASVAHALPAIRRLLDAARARDALVVYVNDNYDQWHAGPRELTERALGSPHHDLVKPIVPAAETPFVVKARHSIFYETQLEYLLRQCGVSRLVLAGQVTEQCILYSALDAYVRHFEICVCSDAVASIHDDLADAALQMMQRNMHAEIIDSADAAF